MRDPEHSETRQSGREHDAHAGHDHDAHAGHDHNPHAGHDHNPHAGHDHNPHAGHDHNPHAGHDHDPHAGHDHHGHDHAHHDHAHDFRSASKKSLVLALVLITGYMAAEIVGGILSGSLALLADAGHMATDAAAIVMALAAIWIAQRGASAERTFGYQRTEVIAALANVLFLWLIVAWICYEAYHRAFTSEEVEVVGLPVLLVGIGGFMVNLAAAWILHRSSGESMNVEGAFQHVMADLLGSVAVIISAALIMGFGWNIADPILSVVIAILIVFNTRKLTGTIFHVLIEGAPAHIDVLNLCSDIEEVEGVTLIHDVHVWTITSGSEAFTAHVLIDSGHTGSREEMLESICAIARTQYGIAHVTVQLEESVSDCNNENHHVDHLAAIVREANKPKRFVFI